MKQSVVKQLEEMKELALKQMTVGTLYDRLWLFAYFVAFAETFVIQSLSSVVLTTGFDLLSSSLVVKTTRKRL